MRLTESPADLREKMDDCRPFIQQIPLSTQLDSGDGLVTRTRKKGRETKREIKREGREGNQTENFQNTKLGMRLVPKLETTGLRYFRKSVLWPGCSSILHSLLSLRRLSE